MRVSARVCACVAVRVHTARSTSHPLRRVAHVRAGGDGGCSRVTSPTHSLHSPSIIAELQAGRIAAETVQLLRLVRIHRVHAVHLARSRPSKRARAGNGSAPPFPAIAQSSCHLVGSAEFGFCSQHARYISRVGRDLPAPFQHHAIPTPSLISL